MLKVKCEVTSCGKELTEKGAILISPPVKGVNKTFGLRDDIDITRKIHICKECYYDILMNYMEG